MTRFYLSACLGLLLSMSACRPSPRAVINEADLPRIDGQATYDLARRQCAIGPRASGTVGAEKTVAFLTDTCRAMGFKPKVDSWQEDTPAGRLTFRNILATRAGRGKGFILLGSHYDTKRLARYPDFIGANDGASSTALLLELMRATRKLNPWPGPSLCFAFFDGEECVKNYNNHDGLHGSRRLARQWAKTGELRQCRGMVLLDMIGDKKLNITFPTTCSHLFIRRIFSIAEKQGVRSHFGFFLNGDILDDHSPFMERGIPAVDFIDFDYGPGNSYWHTNQDSMAHISPESLATVGNVVLHFLVDFPRSDAARLR